MEISAEMKAARALGKVPDWAWAQMNGKSAMENYAEQRRAILDDLNEEEAIPVSIITQVVVK